MIPKGAKVRFKETLYLESEPERGPIVGKGQTGVVTAYDGYAKYPYMVQIYEHFSIAVTEDEIEILSPRDTGWVYSND